jgi:hypothetical protein
MRINLSVPFNNKDEVKKLALWDSCDKLWFYRGTDHGKNRDIDIVKKYELVYLLETKYEDNFFIKENGGVFDEIEKKWRTHISNDKLTNKFKFETSRYYYKGEEIEDEQWCRNYYNNFYDNFEKELNLKFGEEEKLRMVNEMIIERLQKYPLIKPKVNLKRLKIPEDICFDINLLN